MVEKYRYDHHFLQNWKPKLRTVEKEFIADYDYLFTMAKHFNAIEPCFSSGATTCNKITQMHSCGLCLVQVTPAYVS